IVLIPTDQYTGYIDSRTGKIRRAAKRLSREATRIAAHDGLTDEQRGQIMARGSVAGAIAAFSGKKSVARIEGAAIKLGGDPLSLNKTIEAFKRRGACTLLRRAPLRFAPRRLAAQRSATQRTCPPPSTGNAGDS